MIQNTVSYNATMSDSTSGPPPFYDIHASRQPQLFAAEISTFALAVLAVGLRLWCRNFLKSGIGLSERWYGAVRFTSLRQSLNVQFRPLRRDFLVTFYIVTSFPR